MGLATILAWRLKFPSDEFIDQSLEMGIGGGGMESSGVPAPTEITTETGIPHSTVFATRGRKLPEWVIVFKHFKTPNCIAFLIVAWLMGIGIGLIFTFLFWHLQVYWFFFSLLACFHLL